MAGSRFSESSACEEFVNNNTSSTQEQATRLRRRSRSHERQTSNLHRTDDRYRPLTDRISTDRGRSSPPPLRRERYSPPPRHSRSRNEDRQSRRGRDISHVRSGVSDRLYSGRDRLPERSPERNRIDSYPPRIQPRSRSPVPYRRPERRQRSRSRSRSRSPLPYHRSSRHRTRTPPREPRYSRELINHEPDRHYRSNQRSSRPGSLSPPRESRYKRDNEDRHHRSNREALRHDSPPPRRKEQPRHNTSVRENDRHHRSDRRPSSPLRRSTPPLPYRGRSPIRVEYRRRSKSPSQFSQRGKRNLSTTRDTPANKSPKMGDRYFNGYGRGAPRGGRGGYYEPYPEPHYDPHGRGQQPIYYQVDPMMQHAQQPYAAPSPYINHMGPVYPHHSAPFPPPNGFAPMPAPVPYMVPHIPGPPYMAGSPPHIQHYAALNYPNQNHRSNSIEGRHTSGSSRHSAQGSTHSGSPSRGRGTFTNLSWTPSTGRRGGIQLPPKDRNASRDNNKTETGEDDDDNPFRPAKNLRVEDESKKPEQTAAANIPPAKLTAVKQDTQADVPTDLLQVVKPKNNAVPSSGAVNRTLRIGAKEDRQQHDGDKHPSGDQQSLGQKLIAGKQEERRIEPNLMKLPVAEPMKQKRPKLGKEFKKSASEYHRKPGNESVVGSGTYGKVFKATHVYTKTVVALKRIRMEGEKDGFPVTANREIKILQKLKHDNVVKLKEMMTEEDIFYMIFEYLSHDLTGLLNHPTFKLDDAQKKDLARQMFVGLEFLHRRGVLHRDIKAANILVSNTGLLKLADFGLARIYNKTGKHQYTNRVVTIWYRSPELLYGETEYGPSVDIWSAACVMVEIFTRHAIFPGDGGEISQLEKIYDVLGTPSKKTWPDVGELSWAGLLAPVYRVESTFAEKYKDRVTPEAFDLLSKMFTFNPKDRPSAKDAMAHPYFTTELPPPKRAVELMELEGDWHEYESKAFRKEREREARKAKDMESKENKRKVSNGSGEEREPKKSKVEMVASKDGQI